MDLIEGLSFINIYAASSSGMLVPVTKFYESVLTHFLILSDRKQFGEIAKCRNKTISLLKFNSIFISYSICGKNSQTQVFNHRVTSNYI